MSTTYDKAYFIAKFSAIPDERWCVGLQGPNNTACAYDHCRRFGVEPDELRTLLDRISARASYVNDGLDSRYPQPTPKARILAALADLP